MRHGGVEGLDALVFVDRDHAIAELRQDGVQALTLGPLDARGPSHFHGVIQSLSHSIDRIQEDAHQAQVFGAINSRPRPNHHLHAHALELLHAQAGFILRAIGALGHAEGQETGEITEVRQHALVSDQPHLRGRSLGQGERLQHIKAPHFDQHHRHFQVLPQIGTVGTSRHHHINRALGGQVLNTRDRIGESHIHHFHMRPRVKCWREFLQHLVDAAEAHGDDLRR